MNIDSAFPSKYLKASDLQGRRIPVTIAGVEVEDLGDDRRAVLYFKGAERGLVLNKTNSYTIKDSYGSETDDWIGKQIVLYTARVDYQGKRVDAIRIDLPTPDADDLPPKPAPRSTREQLNDDIPF